MWSWELEPSLAEEALSSSKAGLGSSTLCLPLCFSRNCVTLGSQCSPFVISLLLCLPEPGSLTGTWRKLSLGSTVFHVELQEDGPMLYF